MAESAPAFFLTFLRRMTWAMNITIVPAMPMIIPIMTVSSSSARRYLFIPVQASYRVCMTMGTRKARIQLQKGEPVRVCRWYRAMPK